VPTNNDFNPIRVTEENEFLVWGIVVHVIRSL
jgi:SOS-response transcriptional repressor LexA